MRVKWEKQNIICYLSFAIFLTAHFPNCFIEVSRSKPVCWPIFHFPVFHVHHQSIKIYMCSNYRNLKSNIPNILKHFKSLELKITPCYFVVTKLTHVERERAIGMLQANVTQSVAVKHFRCHVRTIVRLNNHFQQTWTTSDSPRPGRRRVMTRRQDRDIWTSHLCYGFYLETVTARTYPGTHNPWVSAKTVRNRFQEICLRPRPPVVWRNLSLVQYLRPI